MKQGWGGRWVSVGRVFKNLIGLQACGCDLEGAAVLQILQQLAVKLWPVQPVVKPPPEPSTPSERLSLASRHRYIILMS